MFHNREMRKTGGHLQKNQRLVQANKHSTMALPNIASDSTASISQSTESGMCVLKEDIPHVYLCCCKGKDFLC